MYLDAGVLFCFVLCPSALVFLALGNVDFCVISSLFGNLCFSVCKHVGLSQWLPAWEAPSLLEGPLYLSLQLKEVLCSGLWLKMPSHSLIQSYAYSLLLRTHSIYSGPSIRCCGFLSERDYLILCLKISVNLTH